MFIPTAGFSPQLLLLPSSRLNDSVETLYPSAHWLVPPQACGLACPRCPPQPAPPLVLAPAVDDTTKLLGTRAGGVRLTSPTRGCLPHLICSTSPVVLDSLFLLITLVQLVSFPPGLWPHPPTPCSCPPRFILYLVIGVIFLEHRLVMLNCLKLPLGLHHLQKVASAPGSSCSLV